MIEKTPIVSQDRKPTNARRSDHCCTLATDPTCGAKLTGRLGDRNRNVGFLKPMTERAYAVAACEGTFLLLIIASALRENRGDGKARGGKHGLRPRR
jgi:hypothetical protein